MKKHVALLFVLSLAAVMVPGVSRADVILYSAPSNQTGGSDLNSYLEADDVTFAGAVVITQIKFWSAQVDVNDYAGSIDWSINLDGGGVPGGSVAAGSATSPAIADTGNLDQFGLEEFTYTFPVSVSAGPGTYWVVLHNGPTGSIPNTNFYWAWSNDTGGNSQNQFLAPNEPWVGNFSELALELQGTTASNGGPSVPEPTSLLLLGTGLLGGVRRWRQRRQQHASV